MPPTTSPERSTKPWPLSTKKALSMRSAKALPRMATKPPPRVRIPLVRIARSLLERNLGHGFGAAFRLEVLLGPEAADLRPPGAGDALDVAVVLLDGVVVALALHREPVLGARELVHQALEVAVGLELRIRFADRHQLADRAFELVRRLDLVGAGARPEHRRARVGDVVEDALLVAGVALHHLDQVGNQVGAALQLVLHLAPGRLDLLLLGDDAVVAAGAAAGEGEDEEGSVLSHAQGGGSHEGKSNTQELACWGERVAAFGFRERV